MDKTTTSKAQSRLVPYDTGKVKIGLFYEAPKPRPEDHELILQNVLLGTPPQKRETLKEHIVNNLRSYIGFVVFFVGYIYVLFRS